MFRWISKLRSISRREAVEKELSEEINAHFEMELQDKLGPGISEQEARAVARRHFGSPALIRDKAMDSWGFAFWDVLLQDLRYAVRTLRLTPAFTVVALLSLAVGIGASTAIFSLMNALIWTKMPVAEP